MNNWINKTNNSRLLLKNLEINKVILKNLLNYNYFKFEYKFNFDKFFNNLHYNASISKIRNYCILLKNNRSIFKKFKMSRHKIKLFAANGILIGLKKSSF